MSKKKSEDVSTEQPTGEVAAEAVAEPVAQEPAVEPQHEPAIEAAPAVEPAPPAEPQKPHSLEEIKHICAGIWAGHNSRASTIDGKPWPELSDGLAAVGKHGDSWVAREDFTARLRHELALLRCAEIALADGDMEAERSAAYAARGVVQIIDAGA